MIVVVLDVNVIISAVLSPNGAPYILLSLWQEGKFTLILSERLLSTLVEKVRSPRIGRSHAIGDDELAELSSKLTSLGRVVDIGEFGALPSTGDPEDDSILATAVAGHADYLVTGDKALLSLQDYEGVKIVSPRVFLDLLQANLTE